ncbi:hypothetical protein [Asticcacaulis sp. EMRT-3]|uniref:hypothetical protein n=1 Tax=Asticcacaulis sp. EMRT-3 TaxID=3040349 RepID=UPI0024AFDEDF|nr:hypothetical protein [Asticcacaulis sp. EMRT-3]MDI7775324.1 hypothetical protein [Asticcacaulis sp. EMRT-3]
MSKHSHAAENFSHFVVAIVIVALAAAVIVWVATNFHSDQCPAGIPCHPGGQPTQVHY